MTLADWAKRIDPEGRVPVVAELLSQSNEILEDAVFMEGNLPTGHRVVIRTGLPTVYWRAINQGIPTSKSTTAQVDEACGMLEAYSEVDKDLAELNGNTAQFRLSEDTAFLEAMNQTQAQTMFYGNPSSDPRQYLGLAARYGAISGAGNAQNILDAGGTSTNNTSIWLVGWGENTCFCTFPKGSKAGLAHEDLGLNTVWDSSGARYQAYRTHYQWKNGLVVKDWRYVVRICNIDVSDLVGQTGTQAASAATNIVKLMARSLYRIPNMAMGRAAFYMNRTVHSGLTVQALDKSQYVLKIEQGLSQFGTPNSWLSFLGVPLRRVDAITNAETMWCQGFSEPNAGSDLANLSTRAVKDGDDYVINGQKTFITNGQNCDLIIVVARTGAAGAKGLSLIVLETRDNPGFKRGRNLDKIGLHASDTSELFFDNAVAPPANLLGGEEGQGFKQLMQQLPQERLIIAIGAVAAMERAIRVTTDYTRERKAFGQPIIEFQNTAFTLAERKTEAFIARVFVDYCIERLVAGDLDAVTASMAKWWTTQKQVETVDECLQESASDITIQTGLIEARHICGKAGLTRPAEVKFTAHAWLRAGDKILTGQAESRMHSTLATFAEEWS